MHQLEKGLTQTEVVKKTFAAVVDGMAFVGKFKSTGQAMTNLLMSS